MPYCGGCDMGVRRVYLSKYFWENLCFFLFFQSFKLLGGMIHFLHYQQAKRARRSTMDPKMDAFCQIDISDLSILGLEKVVFWTFSKFFYICLGSV